MKKSKLVVYNVEWQLLRISLLGKWFSVKNVKENLNKLDSYLGDYKDLNKLYRVVNLLAGVRFAFAQTQQWENLANNKVSLFFNNVSRLYYEEKEKHPLKDFDIATEDDIRKSIRNAMLQTPEKMKAVYKDLYYKRWLPHQNSSHREELRWFLNILEQEGALFEK
jgi:hypothetical protein